MERMELIAQDGTGLFVRAWRAQGEAKAVIIVSHGMGEHCERYAHVADFFNAQGYEFLGFDHRGHGRSKGQRGHIPTYEAMMEEFDLMMSKAKEMFPGLPIILYGHSWGGNLAANYLVRRQPEIRGAIISGAWLTLPPEQTPNPFLGLLAKVMNSLYPSFTNDNQIDRSRLSRDPEVVKAYENDPLVHSKITAGNFIKSSKAGTFVIDNAHRINVPLLILHGSDDKVTSPQGSKMLAEAMGDNAELKIYPGFRHEVHNEPEKAQVMADMLAFTEVILK